MFRSQTAMACGDFLSRTKEKRRRTTPDKLSIRLMILLVIHYPFNLDMDKLAQISSAAVPALR
jgi:hypothetical protein